MFSLSKSTVYGLIAGMILAAMLFYSCRKDESFPVEPVLTYEDFTQFLNQKQVDSVGILKFRFTDGDGDIGLEEGDTVPPYKFNFFIKYFELRKGVWFHDTLAKFDSRIPVLQAGDKKKPLKGTIEMKVFHNNPLSAYDTIRFECYIMDKALHKSNVVTTPAFKVKKK